MTQTESQTSQEEDGEHPIDIPLLEQLVHHVKENDPQILKDALLSKINENPTFNAEDIELMNQAISFMDEVHDGQNRKYNFQPAEPKPFTTHTLATALMVYELMGEKITADNLVVALLHDVIEDGEIAEDRQSYKRKVIKSDIIERLGKRGEVSPRIIHIADAIEALSNVRGEGAERKKLSHEQYFRNIETANATLASEGIDLIPIKISDRSTNLLDPFRRVRPEHGDLYQMPQPGKEAHPKKKDAFTSRRDHIENTQTYLYPLLQDNSPVGNYMQSVIDLADLTCQPRFIPILWKPQLRFHRYLNRRKQKK